MIDVGRPDGREEYARKNPLQSTPGLVVEGQLIPDSTAICEFLEEAFLDSPLLPERPLERAVVRTIAEVSDHQVLRPALSLLRCIGAQARDAEQVGDAISNIRIGLGWLDRLVPEHSSFAAGESLTLADCMLAPALFTVSTILDLLQVDNPLVDHPKIRVYWTAMEGDRIAATVLGEMKQATRERFGTRG
jgi:glutathione S-transferase